MAYARSLKSFLPRVHVNNICIRQSAYASQLMPSCCFCQKRELCSSNFVETRHKTSIGSHNTSNIQFLTRSASNTTNVASTDSQKGNDENKIISTLRSWARSVFRKSILFNSAKNIYECCSDDIDYKLFFKVCNLSDTFQSWFQVVHLHFWMCYVRLKADGKDGQIVQKQMTECMWEDVKERMKILGVEDRKVMKKSFNELAEQFYGVTIAYNKGYMDENENALARAIWRNLFDENEETDRKNLDVIMQYVSEQMNVLDEMDSEHLLTKGKIEWLPLEQFMSQKIEE